jgi:hypothetical protein
MKRLSCMARGRRRNLYVLRQTSGALRQTEGKQRPRRARARRKSAPLQMLDPHGEARSLVVPEFHRCLKHLCPHEATQRGKNAARCDAKSEAG